MAIAATKADSRQIQAKHGLRQFADTNRSLASREGVAIGYQCLPGAKCIIRYDGQIVDLEEGREKSLYQAEEGGFGEYGLLVSWGKQLESIITRLKGQKN